ncbi:leptin receptor [Roseibium sp. TrichSKD4]|nr:leptin receptor [Roseibium sp. TrichSKD4]
MKGVEPQLFETATFGFPAACRAICVPSAWFAVVIMSENSLKSQSQAGSKIVEHGDCSRL